MSCSETRGRGTSLDRTDFFHPSRGTGRKGSCTWVPLSMESPELPLSRWFHLSRFLDHVSIPVEIVSFLIRNCFLSFNHLFFFFYSFDKSHDLVLSPTLFLFLNGFSCRYSVLCPRRLPFPFPKFQPQPVIKSRTETVNGRLSIVLLLYFVTHFPYFVHESLFMLV